MTFPGFDSQGQSFVISPFGLFGHLKPRNHGAIPTIYAKAYAFDQPSVAQIYRPNP